jgi:hypothetical protein
LEKLGEAVFGVETDFLSDTVSADLNPSCRDVEQRGNLLRQKVHADIGTNHLLFMREGRVPLLEGLKELVMNGVE